MVVLTILKICGIVLLCMIGLILFLAILILIVPFRYSGKAYREDNSLAKGSVSWLLSIVRISAEYKDLRFKAVLRVFGIPVKRIEESFKAAKTGTEEFFAEEYPEEELPEEEYQEEDLQEEDLQEEDRDNRYEEKIVTAAARGLGDKPSEKKEEKNAKKKSFKASSDTDPDSPERKKKPQKKEASRTGWADKLSFIISELKNEEIKKFFKRFKRSLIKLVRHIGPRRLKGSLSFGFENPQYTGKLLALLSVIYPLYGKHFNVYPDFENKCFKCDVYLKGHVRVLSGGLIVLKVLFSKDYKRFKNELFRATEVLFNG